jgi:5-methylcytosine-specific restriction endonuclease McrBC GTP-binding regulatory subunit McrB
MYSATYSNDVYLTVLDEMNIARVEYYFAEMLSILEIADVTSGLSTLFPSGWPSDPNT